MKRIQPIAGRRQQVRRRLSELELAVRIGGELDVAWHMTQASRSGASLPEIVDAIQLGVKMRGTPAVALTECADELVRRLRDTGNRLWSGRESSVGMLSPC
jgi:hypothetical protein